ncbi:Decarboxylase family protein [Elusimicrobium minutum Pei191]|uniref:Decarboxylase family protein n=1 Tax=Elusimicrobium minutum (strain Pei191) TaxID=445932 RepID=B2KD34_ELUMP|nr:carboxymuconolactone decarboxylase family protein [Elusimicrobium minutum]ACC98430.1 Decarboxylase family protein [Elusimicrobium minutum Pei191]
MENIKLKNLTLIMAVLISVLSFSYIAQSVELQALTPRQQSIAKIAALTAVGDLDKLNKALHEGLDNKLTINEIKEVLIQMYAYSGFPRSLNAINTFIGVLEDRKAKGIKDVLGPEAKAVSSSKSKFDTGAENLAKLTGAKTVTKNTSAYALFAPASHHIWESLRLLWF